MLEFLLNLLFGVGAWYLTDYLLSRLGVSDPVKVIVAFIVGVLVFVADWADKVL